MKKYILLILLFLFLTFNQTFATGDIYNVYNLPNSSIDYLTGHTLAISHIDGNFYINDKFFEVLILKVFLTFFGLLTFIILSFKSFNQGKK